MSFVQVERLRVKYGSFVAVGGISFEIPKGEVFGFIGPNGAGKTTTIKVLATLLRPTSGLVRVGGLELAHAPKMIRSRIGYVPDSFGVYDDLTAYEYMNFFAAAYRVDSKRRKALIEDLLSLTDLSTVRNTPVQGLSRGMRQRLSLARSLIHDPDFLLLDEPASGLDPRARIEFREFLKVLQEMGKTILISSHILHELAQLCTRIGIIEAGAMVAEGPVDELLRAAGVDRVVHVQIANPTEFNAATFEALPGVRSVEVQGDRFAFTVDEDRTTMESLLLSIQGTGVSVKMFQPAAIDMETAFMKLTKGTTR
ncbi:MAG: ABC transporter ATP-binding protein [Planctomycetota bacterium]